MISTDFILIFFFSVYSFQYHILAHIIYKIYHNFSFSIRWKFTTHMLCSHQKLPRKRALASHLIREKKHSMTNDLKWTATENQFFLFITRNCFIFFLFISRDYYLHAIHVAFQLPCAAALSFLKDKSKQLLEFQEHECCALHSIELKMCSVCGPIVGIFFR